MVSVLLVNNHHLARENRNKLEQRICDNDKQRDLPQNTTTFQMPNQRTTDKRR